MRMSRTTPLTITREQVDLLSVRGRLDWAGLLALQSQVDRLLDSGARFLVADLSEVEYRDGRLPDLLARTSALVARRGGWLRLVGPGTSILSTVEQTPLPTARPKDHHPARARRAVEPA